MSTEVAIFAKDKQLFASLKALPKESLLKTPIGIVPFGVRAANVFKTANIHTLADLVQKSRLDLLKTPNMGVTTLKIIEVYLKGLGLGLAAQDANGATVETIRDMAANTQTQVRRLEADLRVEREKNQKLSALLVRAGALIQNMQEILQ